MSWKKIERGPMRPKSPQSPSRRRTKRLQAARIRRERDAPVGQPCFLMRPAHIKQVLRQYFADVGPGSGAALNIPFRLQLVEGGHNGRPRETVSSRKIAGGRQPRSRKQPPVEDRRPQLPA